MSTDPAAAAAFDPFLPGQIARRFVGAVHTLAVAGSQSGEEYSRLWQRFVWTDSDNWYVELMNLRPPFIKAAKAVGITYTEAKAGYDPLIEIAMLARKHGPAMRSLENQRHREMTRQEDGIGSAVQTDSDWALRMWEFNDKLSDTVMDAQWPVLNEFDAMAIQIQFERGEPLPPPRLTMDPSSRAILLDSKEYARELGEEAYYFLTALVRAYPGPIKFDDIKSQFSEHILDENKTRVKERAQGELAKKAGHRRRAIEIVGGKKGGSGPASVMRCRGG
jgi:hypothetical protein